MPLPSSPTWDLADFDADTIGSLLTLGPGNVTIVPGTTPWFSYPNSSTLRVSSDDGTRASLVMNTSVPQQFTFEIAVRFQRLPRSGADLSRRRAALTVADGSGRGLTLYFTASGISLSRVDDFGSAILTPDSSRIVQESSDRYVTVRVVCDAERGLAFVYTGEGETDVLVHAYTLPLLETPLGYSDTFTLEALGRPEEPVLFDVRRLRLASSLVVSDFPPTADAGEDRVTSLGQVIRLDGRRSYDAEGSPLTYLWRLTDAPYGSEYAADNSSGSTTDDGDADGVTDTLDFAANSLPAWVAVGDVVRVNDAFYTITTINNPAGFLIVDADSIPDSLTSTPFRVFRQSLLVGATTETPYAVPDLQGIYRFQLIVNDGRQDSVPSEVLASVVGARAPFGIEPDTSFLWRALGDDWQQVENRLIFQELWTGVAQLMSGKLLEAWQYHYNYSIRDAQPYFQKKWVPYRTLLAETQPDDVTIDARYGFLRASHAFESGAPLVVGETLDISYYTGTDLEDIETVSVVLGSSSLPNIVSAINAALVGSGITAVAAPTMDAVGSVRNEAEGTLTGASLSFTPGDLSSWVGVGDYFVMNNHRATITAVDLGLGTATLDTPIVVPQTGTFRIYRRCRLHLQSTTRGFWVGGTAAAALGIEEDVISSLHGVEGALATDRSYIVEAGTDLGSFGVSQGDLLVLNNGQSHVVERLLTHPLDPFPNQRVLLRDELPMDASTTWDIASRVLSTSLDFENELVYPDDLLKVEVLDLQTGNVTQHAGVVVGISGSSLGVFLRDLYAVLANPARYEMRVLGVRRRRAIPLPDDVVSIPRLQDLIPVAQNPTILRENLEYILEPFYRGYAGAPIPAIQFRDTTYVVPDTEPPDILWAEVVLFDNSPNVENLFGRLVGFRRDDAASFGPGFNYIAATGGLMLALQSGALPEAIRIGAQILLGQTFAEARGEIIELRTDFSPTRGRLLVRDLDAASAEIVRTYYYKKQPSDLSDTSGLAVNPRTGLPWAVGDTINAYEPIGTGVEVVDTKNDPHWYIPFVRTRMITEVEKFMTYLVRFDLDVTSVAQLTLLLQFVMKSRPTYGHPLLLGLRYHQDSVDIEDEAAMRADMFLFDSLHDTGRAFMYDDYRGDGTIWSSFDDGVTSYDGLLNVPLDTIVFVLEIDWPGGPITIDSPFFFDTDVLDVSGAHVGAGNTFTPTYDLNLPAGTYRVTANIKSGPVVPP